MKKYESHSYRGRKTTIITTENNPSRSHIEFTFLAYTFKQLLDFILAGSVVIGHTSALLKGTITRTLPFDRDLEVVRNL